MTSLDYVRGRLHLGGVALDELALEHGTPLFVYGAERIRERTRGLIEAFGEAPPLVFYALKANATLGVVAVVAGAGVGADVVSAGELERALMAGIAPDRILFAGVGKERFEIERALEVEILQFNVEAVEELALIDQVARSIGKRAPIALRLNPDVRATTHEKITTGRRNDKFGIAAERLDEALDVVAGLDHVELVGLHCHIGSQIGTLDDFSRAYDRMSDFWRHAVDRGFPLQRLNLGGGFGIRYVDEPEIDVASLATVAARIRAATGATLAFEPGRYLVADAGVLLSRVVRVKAGADGRRFVVVDAGMNNLLRPAMYGAVHPLLPVRRDDGGVRTPADVVGPICESSDVFEREALLPALAEDDLVAFTNAGAYGAVMASDYNSKGMAAEVLVDDGRVHVVKPRRTALELARDEVVPPHLVRRGVPAAPAA